MLQKNNQEVDLFAGFKIACEIPSLNKEKKKKIKNPGMGLLHVAEENVGWGGPVCPIPGNMDSPGQSGAGQLGKC